MVMTYAQVMPLEKLKYLSLIFVKVFFNQSLGSCWCRHPRHMILGRSIQQMPDSELRSIEGWSLYIFFLFDSFFGTEWYATKYLILFFKKGIVIRDSCHYQKKTSNLMLQVKSVRKNQLFESKFRDKKNSKWVMIDRFGWKSIFG